MSYHNCCIALWRLFVLLHVLSIKGVFYAKGYHHIFLEPELWNFCFVLFHLFVCCVAQVALSCIDVVAAIHFVTIWGVENLNLKKS